MSSTDTVRVSSLRKRTRRSPRQHSPSVPEVLLALAGDVDPARARSTDHLGDIVRGYRLVV